MRPKWVTGRKLMVVVLFASIGTLLGGAFTLRLLADNSPAKDNATARGRLSQSNCPSCGSPKFSR